jgi:uncharacterized protein (TIGR03000 family)
MILLIASPAAAQRGHSAPTPAPMARPTFSATPHDVLHAFGLGPNAGFRSGAPLTPRNGFSPGGGGFNSTAHLFPPLIGAPDTWFPSRTTSFSTAPLFPYASASFPYGYGFYVRELPEETQRKPYVPEISVEPDPTAATMDVRVPADAEIWFEGTKTGQRGLTRTFVSPPLAKGQAFTYDIRARWKEGDKEVDQTRQINVRAGDHVQVYFAKK